MIKAIIWLFAIIHSAEDYRGPKIPYKKHIIPSKRTEEQSKKDNIVKGDAETLESAKDVRFNEVCVLAFYSKGIDMIQGVFFQKSADFLITNNIIANKQDWWYEHWVFLARNEQDKKYYLAEFNGSSRIFQLVKSSFDDLTSLLTHRLADEKTWSIHPWTQIQEPKTITDFQSQIPTLFAAHFEWNRWRGSCQHFAEDMFCKNAICSPRKSHKPFRNIPRRIINLPMRYDVPSLSDVGKMSSETARLLVHKLQNPSPEESLCVRMFTKSYPGKRDTIFKAPSFHAALKDTRERLVLDFERTDLEYTKVYLTYKQGRGWRIKTWNDRVFAARGYGSGMNIITLGMINGTGTVEFEIADDDADIDNKNILWDIHVSKNSENTVEATIMNVARRESLFANEDAVYVNNKVTTWKFVACPDNYFLHGIFEENPEQTALNADDPTSEARETSGGTRF